MGDTQGCAEDRVAYVHMVEGMSQVLCTLIVNFSVTSQKRSGVKP